MKARIYFIFIFILGATGLAHAQWGIGLRLNSVSWLDNQGYTEDGKSTGFYSPSKANGIGVEGYYLIKPRMRINLILEYEGTINQETIHDTAIGGQIYHEYVNVNTPATIIRADFNYAFTHNFVDKGFTFYGIGGLALNAYTYTTSYGVSTTGQNGSIISSNSAEQKRSYSGLSLSLGLGISYAFNENLRLFLDVRGCSGQMTNFSVAQFHSSNPDFLPSGFNPAYIGSALGIRYNLPQEKQPEGKP